MLIRITTALSLSRLKWILLLGALMCACTSSYTTHTGNTGDYVSMNNGRLGWSGIFLNETRSDVKKKLGNSLEVHAQAFPTCGQFASHIALNNREVTLQWSMLSMNATIDSIYVDLPIDEYALSPVAIAEQIKNRLPHLELATSGNDSSQLNYPHSEEILIKNGEDNFLLVSLESCLD